MIKTVFFDAAGTLFHPPRGVGWHYRDVAARFGCTLDEDALAQAFKTVWKQMPEPPAIYQPYPDDNKGWWFNLVEKVLDHTGVSPTQLDRHAYFEVLYTEFTLPNVWQLYPDVLETISALRTRFRLGLISNFDGRLRPVLTHLGLGEAFDPLIISSEVGVEKPHAWIFQRALEEASIAPHEALHVGDDPLADWEGAATAGLHVFRLDRPKNSLRDVLTHLENGE
jgi:putative hydrolase of the HAD superfamily